jgi:hypothetical protein
MSGESIMYRVGKESGEAAAAIIESLADKKIKFGEGVGIAKELAGLVMIAIANHTELATRLKDGISDEESEELSEGFHEGFDLQNDLAESEVEEYFGLVLNLIDSIVQLVNKAAA